MSDFPEDTDVLRMVEHDLQRLKGFRRTAIALRLQAQGTAHLASTILFRSHVAMANSIHSLLSYCHIAALTS